MARLVGHTVIEQLRELEGEFQSARLKLEVVGLDRHRAVSAHPATARKLAPSMWHRQKCQYVEHADSNGLVPRGSKLGLTTFSDFLSSRPTESIAFQFSLRRQKADL